MVRVNPGPEAIIVPIVFAVIFLVGVAGNGVLIFAILANRRMRNTPNILIVNLAVGDMLLLLVSVPFTATLYTFHEWPYGEAVCKLNEFLQALSLAATVFTLMALSADRYVAIVDPIGKHKSSSKLATLLIVGAIWLLSIALATPEAVAARLETQQNIEICTSHPTVWGERYPKFHAMYRFLVYCVLPVVVIATFYLLIARTLVRSSRYVTIQATQSGDGGQLQRQDAARKKVAKIVLSFVVIFIACWLPRHIFRLWYQYDPNPINLFWHVFKIVGFCLSFANSCINPFTLYVLSRQFRQYYDKYLFCCCCRPLSRSQRDSLSGIQMNTLENARTRHAIITKCATIE